MTVKIGFPFFKITISLLNKYALVSLTLNVVCCHPLMTLSSSLMVYHAQSAAAITLHVAVALISGVWWSLPHFC